MGCILRLLFTLVPGAILAGGAVLSIQAARFWIDTVGPPQNNPIVVPLDPSTEIEVVSFVPSSIRPELSPIPLETEVSFKSPIQSSTEVSIEVTDDCNFIRVDNGKETLVFDVTTGHVQSAEAQLVTRNSRPSPNCTFFISVQSGPYVAVVEHSVPINGWTGHLMSVGKLLTGLLASGIGLKGILATLFGL